MINVKVHIRTISLLITVLFASQIYAQQDNWGGFPEAYLRRDVGARAIGLGGAYTAVCNEPSAVYYNPAGLAFLSDRPQFSTMFTALSFNRQHNFLSYGQTFEDFLGVGIGVNNYYAGAFTGRNASGDPLGDYVNQQLAAQGSIAVRMISTSIGITGKYLLNSLKGANIKANGWGIDVGTKIQLLDILSVGIAAQNVAGQMKWNDAAGTTEALNYTIRAGIAAEFGFNEEDNIVRTNVLGTLKNVKKTATSYALVTIDGSFTHFDKVPKFTIGGEIAPIQQIILRAGLPFYTDDIEGKRLLNFKEYSYGISLKPNFESVPFQFQIDYAAAKDISALGGISQHISIILEF